MPTLHTVLGATGASGREVLTLLTENKALVRAVTRSSVLSGYDTVHADLLDREAASEAVSGSTHVYLCVGLPYRLDVWLHDWPLIMDNVISACAYHMSWEKFQTRFPAFKPTPYQQGFQAMIDSFRS